MEEEKNKNKISQLRQDLVTGDWVVIATNRAKKPEDFANAAREIEKKVEPARNASHSDAGGEKDCFFCFPEETQQEKDVLMYQNGEGEWSLRVFPNKYPAFTRSRVPKHFEEGPYFGMDGTGYHEIIVTRSHEKSLANLDNLQVSEVLDAYQERYIDLMNKKSVNFIEIFHNHGPKAGATIKHPHSQLMAIPVISPYIQGELDGAEHYYRSTKECVYCMMNEWECETQKRVIFENKEFVAYCPFASRAAFEIWVVPKKHKPYFERMTALEKVAAGEALRVALHKIYQALNNPDYNFYIHTAPCDGRDYPHYHWHIEILPKTTPWAGFELSTGIEISTIQPEIAAEYLRNI